MGFRPVLPDHLPYFKFPQYFYQLWPKNIAEEQRGNRRVRPRKVMYFSTLKAVMYFTSG
jgi:hypothetical protein